MKKRFTSTLLIASLTAASLTGCGVHFAVNDSASTAAEAPAYIEPEYVEPAYTEPVYSEPASESTKSSYEDSECEESASLDIYYGNVNAPEAPACADAAGCERVYNGCYASEYECLPIYGNYGEKYNEVSENTFMNAVTSPLSTFSADIDTASYSNLRRMITDGYRLEDIPAGAIRTEELVNYFNYNYKDPRRGEAFAVNASIIDCPWNKETKLVNLGIKARELRDTKNIPSNIVFLIDVSGSMKSYDKLPLLQMGFDMLAEDLDENDRVSIVTYASSSDVVIAGVPGNEHTKIKRALNSLTASGSTNGGDGIKTAYKLAEKYFIEGGNNRVIMATDGDLNVGITSEDELEELISDKKEGGVFLSVLGFGTGNYNESTLETLADKGNGNYSYIDGLTEAKKVLVDEFNSTLFTVAKDVKFQIEFNPKYVSEYRQIGYENRQMAAKDFNDDTKDGGEVGSGHTMTVMYEIKLNDTREDNKEGLRYQDAELSELAKDSDEWMMVSVRYKDPEADDSRLMTFPISKQCYTNRPDCDTLFAAYVAECGMILNHSEYIDDLDMRDVAKQVGRLTLSDEYKEEFAQLIDQLI